MVIALYILLCFVVSSVAADCSTVYFINKPGNISVSRGTSIRFDTQFIDAYTVDETLLGAIKKVFSCVEPISINTDFEAENRDRIDQWMIHECPRYDRCYVLSSLSYTLLTSEDPYVFRVKKHAQNHAVHARTNSPTGYEIPEECELRKESECVDKYCSYYGIMYGCRSSTFCDFKSKSACEMYPHCLYRRRCIRNPFV